MKPGDKVEGVLGGGFGTLRVGVNRIGSGFASARVTP